MANVDILLCHIAPKLLDVINSLILKPLVEQYEIKNKNDKRIRDV